MSFQEKRIVVSTVTGAILLAAYIIYAFNRAASGAVAGDDLKFWAGMMLPFIGIGIVASIVIQIVFHILFSISVAVTKKIEDEAFDEKDIEKSIDAEMVEDERDRLIGMKSTQIGFFLAAIGFVAALISLMFDYPPAVMLNVLYVAFSLASLVEGIAQLVFYRRGVANG